uniref:Single domain-containing protein n=1 Tax=Magallana gigas TaxID=29159 RepID=A0A8W8HXY9_MAGGI
MTLKSLFGILILFSVLATVNAGNNCYWNGREYDDGDQITYENASPCKEYKCVNGIVELTHYMCPACTSRMHTIKLPWECCPRCIHLK